MALRHDIKRGAACMLAAHLLFSIMNVFVKQLSETLHFVELMFFRNVFALPVMAFLLWRTHGWGRLRTKRFPGHVMRAGSGLLAQGCGFFALGVLPLADQVVLGYTTPLFVTILAIPLLGEKVRLHRWSAVVVGFLGVLVIAVGQGAGQVALGGALAVWGLCTAIAQGFFSALTTMLVRQLSATETSLTITMWQSLLMSAFTLLLLPFFWRSPSLGQLLAMMALGILGGVAQVLLTEAYASAQVSSLGPYSYSSLLWSLALGWLVWGDVPTAWMLVGSAMIMAAGLYILHRELVRRAEREAAAKGV